MTDVLELASALRYQRRLYRLPTVRRPLCRAGIMVTGKHIAGATYGVMAFVTMFHSFDNAYGNALEKGVEGTFFALVWPFYWAMVYFF